MGLIHAGQDFLLQVHGASLVGDQEIVRAVLIVQREPINQGGAGFIKPNNLDLRAFPAELQHHLVQALTAVMSQKWARLTSI